MEFADVLRRRRMIRTFTAEPLAEGTADRLLKAASRAPSAGFSQGFSFLVLEGEEQCAPFWRLIFAQAEQEADERMHRLVEGISQAPLVIVPMASKDVYLDEGLGAVFFGPPDFADFRAEFGVPPEWTPIGAIAVGRFDPGSNPVGPGLRSRRKPLADLVHRGRW